jgi:selT/selW/selH-like putative selenoprotein
LAADLQQRYQVEAELIPSGGGVFEVEADGTLVFSKKALDRFPEHEEVFQAIDKLKA